MSIRPSQNQRAVARPLPVNIFCKIHKMHRLVCLYVTNRRRIMSRFIMCVFILAPELAFACGGLFCNAQTPVNQAAERILFAQTDDGSMHVRITYEGHTNWFSTAVPQDVDYSLSPINCLTNSMEALDPASTCGQMSVVEISVGQQMTNFLLPQVVLTRACKRLKIGWVCERGWGPMTWWFCCLHPWAPCVSGSTATVIRVLRPPMRR